MLFNNKMSYFVLISSLYILWNNTRSSMDIISFMIMLSGLYYILCLMLLMLYIVLYLVLMSLCIIIIIFTKMIRIFYKVLPENVRKKLDYLYYVYYRKEYHKYCYQQLFKVSNETSLIELKELIRGFNNKSDKQVYNRLVNRGIQGKISSDCLYYLLADIDIKRFFYVLFMNNICVISNNGPKLRGSKFVECLHYVSLIRGKVSLDDLYFLKRRYKNWTCSCVHFEDVKYVNDALDDIIKIFEQNLILYFSNRIPSEISMKIIEYL